MRVWQLDAPCFHLSLLPMKNRTTLLFAAVAAAITINNASAGILIAGFHDFDASTTAESADVTVSGVTATVNKPGLPNVGSEGTNGSPDGTYGSGVDAQGFVLPAAGVNDGYLYAAATSIVPLNIVIQNVSSGKDFILGSLLLDMSAMDPLSELTVSYSLGSNSGSFPAVTNTMDFSQEFSFAGLLLPVGETLSIIFQSSSGLIGIDNVALTAIPEPGSLAVLGCLVGSGVFLRSRSRKKVAAA